MELTAKALTTTFVLTLNGLVATASSASLDATMQENQITDFVAAASDVQTELGTVIVRSAPEGVFVQSNIYSDPQIVEVLSAVVARIARVVNSGTVL